MRGWVYIISNPAMPGIFKVGYSSKDPELRAVELNHTGAPHSYKVEFDVLVEDPYALEQKVHRTLTEHHEGREWFRCSLSTIIDTLCQIAGETIILKNDRQSFVEIDLEEVDFIDADERQRVPLGSDSQNETIESPDGYRTVSDTGFSRTATFNGPCGHCGKVYTVTLTRHDSSVLCPYCYKRTFSDFFKS